MSCFMLLIVTKSQPSIDALCAQSTSLQFDVAVDRLCGSGDAGVLSQLFEVACKPVIWSRNFLLTQGVPNIGIR